MAVNTLAVSSIYLTIICAFLIIISFLFNFTFLVTLLKLRRLNKFDKSSFFLTHLIFADFVCAFFILIPSGYGIYNQSYLSISSCHVQLYFTTFFFSLTFQGLFALSIERYRKYQNPIAHVNFFTVRHKADETGNFVRVTKHGFVTVIILSSIWILNIFIALIPLFNNYNNVQYFENQSQCDYQYEVFQWWLWFFFFFCITIPFLGALVFFILTFRLIYKNEIVIHERLNTYRATINLPVKTLDRKSFLNELFFPILYWNKKVVDDNLMQNNKRKHTRRVADTTRLPENVVYYSHLVNVESSDGVYDGLTNDIHVRKQLLVQFKYETERSKVATYFYILVISYILVFPVYVIHFYRTYTNGPSATNFDDSGVVGFNTYTTFVWISYITLVVKSLVCLIHNKFYRYSLYQSANCRGFHGTFDYELTKIKNKLNNIEQNLGMDHKDNEQARS